MLMPIGTYVRQGQRLVRRVTTDPKTRDWVIHGLCVLAGFLLSAASLANAPLPLAVCVLCAGLGNIRAVALALGNAAGYLVFWGSAGAQGLVWTASGLLLGLTLGEKRINRSMPLLLPVLSGLAVAISGLMFLAARAENIRFTLYILRVLLTVGGTKVFCTVLDRRDPVMDWLACAMGVLALAQVAVFPGFSLGMVAVGALAVTAPFPAVALSGLALDLAQITPTPMTAVLCLAFFLRLVPGVPQWVYRIASVGVYLMVASLCGTWDMSPVAPILAGGLLSGLLPQQASIAQRRGQTGVAQVRLEMAAGVLAQTEQLLLETPENPIDEGALIVKAVERACIVCPCRKTCKEQEEAMKMTPSILHRPLIGPEDVPLNCRKRGRMLTELRRSQEQLRAIRADRDRQREYRSAITQQYHFLADYLQELADSLPKKAEPMQPRFDPEVCVCTAGLEGANGDRCMWFAGPGCQYFVLLCDGMGTGIGAQEESRVAGNMLRKLLAAGYPAEYALRSLNHLCALRDKAGAVTVDLTQIDLQTGKATVYKWGGAPSYLVSGNGTQKIGTAGPPPGLSVTYTRETVDKLSLRRGQTLIMVSDGVDGEAVMRRAWELTDATAGDAAAKVLRYGRGEGEDDATAAVIRLHPFPSST